MTRTIRETVHHRTGGLLISSPILLASWGCEDEKVMAPDVASQIEGDVLGDRSLADRRAAAAGVEGAVVQAVRIEADGSMTVVSESDAVTDAQGHFVVMTRENTRGLLVVARKDAWEWSAVVSAETRPGLTVVCRPLNDESTLKAKVFANLSARGMGSIGTCSDVALGIDDRVAAGLMVTDEVIERIADGFEAAIEARSRVMMAEAWHVSAGDLARAEALLETAQVGLETDLDEAAGEEGAVHTAIELYEDARIEAYEEAGIPLPALILAEEASRRAALSATVDMDAMTRFHIHRNMLRYDTGARTWAAEVAFELLGAAHAEIDAVVEAGVQLRGAINAATGEGEVASAQRAFRDEILARLQLAMGGRSTAVMTMHGLIHGPAGARETLRTAVERAADANAMADAYLDFSAAVRTLVQETLRSEDVATLEGVAQALVITDASF